MERIEIFQKIVKTGKSAEVNINPNSKRLVRVDPVTAYELVLTFENLSTRLYTDFNTMNLNKLIKISKKGGLFLD